MSRRWTLAIMTFIVIAGALPRVAFGAPVNCQLAPPEEDPEAKVYLKNDFWNSNGVWEYEFNLYHFSTNKEETAKATFVRCIDVWLKQIHKGPKRYTFREVLGALNYIDDDGCTACDDPVRDYACTTTERVYHFGSTQYVDIERFEMHFMGREQYECNSNVPAQLPLRMIFDDVECWPYDDPGSESLAHSFESLGTHELGHVFGAPDLDDGPCISNPCSKRDTYPTMTTHAQCFWGGITCWESLLKTLSWVELNWIARNYDAPVPIAIDVVSLSQECDGTMALVLKGCQVEYDELIIGEASGMGAIRLRKQNPTSVENCGVFSTRQVGRRELPTGLVVYDTDGNMLALIDERVVLRAQGCSQGLQVSKNPVLRGEPVRCLLNTDLNVDEVIVTILDIAGRRIGNCKSATDDRSLVVDGAWLSSIIRTSGVYLLRLSTPSGEEIIVSRFAYLQ